jgi:dsRNA-specific ribonuclease
MREESRDNEKPFITVYHVFKTMYLTPRDTNHSEEYSAKSVGWLRQSGKTTLHYTIVDRERRQERTHHGYQIGSHYVHLAAKHPQAKYVC